MPIQRALFAAIATTLSSFSLIPPILAQQVRIPAEMSAASQIDLYPAPNSSSPAVDRIYPGDRYTLTEANSGSDGATWYFALPRRSTSVGGWVREDQLVAAGVRPTVVSGRSRPVGNSNDSTDDDPSTVANTGNSVQYEPLSNPVMRTTSALYPRSSSSPREITFEAPAGRSTAATSLPQPVSPPNAQPAMQRQAAPQMETAYVAPPRTTLPRTYTSEQISYFMEVAMGSEFGQGNPTIRKWSGAVRIKVNGNPTAQDMRSLQEVISDLNRLTQGIELQLVQSNPNIEIFFAPEAQFSRIESNYRPRNMGFFWTWWSGNTITRARILISTTGVTQQERSHLIREEVTQSLGLMQDSNRYADSIFYEGWTSVTRYSPMDEAIISMLYRPEIRAGMTQAQAMTALRGLSNTMQSANPRSLQPDLYANQNGALDFSLPPVP